MTTTSTNFSGKCLCLCSPSAARFVTSYICPTFVLLLSTLSQFVFCPTLVLPCPNLYSYLYLFVISNEFKPEIKLTSSFRLANVFASVHLLPPDLSHPYLCPTFALPCPTFVLHLSYLIPILLCPTFLC